MSIIYEKNIVKENKYHIIGGVITEYMSELVDLDESYGYVNKYFQYILPSFLNLSANTYLFFVTSLIHVGIHRYPIGSHQLTKISRSNLFDLKRIYHAPTFLLRGFWLELMSLVVIW